MTGGGKGGQYRKEGGLYRKTVPLLLGYTI